MQTQALSADTIVAQLDAQTQAAVPVTLLASVDSTNAWCLRQARQAVAPPHACLAERQSQGRGRRGRQWQSTAGDSICLSLLWRFAQPLNTLGLLPLAMGLAVRDCLHHIGVEQAILKWPNDVLVDKRKIAGVLIETASHSATSTDLVIGVGLNVALDADTMPPDIEWTDVRQHLPAASLPPTDELAGQLLQRLIDSCRGMQHRDSLWQRLQACFPGGRAVQVLTAQGERLDGIMLGITQDGELRVQVGDVERIFSSADISLRPVQDVTRERALAAHD